MKTLSIIFLWSFLLLIFSCSKIDQSLLPEEAMGMAEEAQPHRSGEVHTITSDLSDELIDGQYILGAKGGRTYTSCGGASVTANTGSIGVTVNASNVSYIKISNQNYGTVAHLCTSWTKPNCNNGVTTSQSVPSGTYRVFVYYTDGSSCEISNVKVGASGCTDTNNCSGVTISGCADKIELSVNASNISVVKISNQSYATVAHLCTYWSNPNCNNGVVTSQQVPPGTYRVFVYYTDGSSCEASSVVVGN